MSAHPDYMGVWCPTCQQDCIPMRSGRCGFCDTRVIGPETDAQTAPVEPPTEQSDVKAPAVANDPVDVQSKLFADPPRCTAQHCQAGDRKNLCKHDADQAHGLEYKPRPRGCIVTFQLPDDQPLPF